MHQQIRGKKSDTWCLCLGKHKEACIIPTTSYQTERSGNAPSSYWHRGRRQRKALPKTQFPGAQFPKTPTELWTAATPTKSYSLHHTLLGIIKLLIRSYSSSRFITSGSYLEFYLHNICWRLLCEMKILTKARAKTSKPSAYCKRVWLW